MDALDIYLAYIAKIENKSKNFWRSYVKESTLHPWLNVSGGLLMLIRRISARKKFSIKRSIKASLNLILTIQYL